MTNQEMFDKVVAHARAQNCKAIIGAKCLYRGPNGTKCFIGALIPDDKYSTALENKMVGRPEVMEAAGLLKEQAGLANSLQQIHDNYSVTQWEHGFESVARIHNLTYTPPTE